MQEYVAQQTRVLLRRLAYQLSRASRMADAEAVHDLRVAIRRFGQCLRVFRDFYPAGKAKKIREQLKELMDLAAQVRDRDIALGLLRKSGVAETSADLRKERKRAEKELMAASRRASGRNFSRKWRAWLEIN